ncbi:MAG TPA: sigma-54 dependent transcriptional regulator [Gemmatimonadaceae bacterium]|nr:sigma-54 dependent transcriptional regulator [Gemmatimonadaceae bacterium]
MSDAPGNGRIRVLIAEDEENLAQILSTFLRGRGHHVVCVGDGRAALQAVRDESFDVALFDIVMPEMDGLEALKQLRAEPDPPEVIIITGNGTIETAITAMKLGAYDYMAKPYRMAEIDVLVRRAWEKHQLARENRYLQARLSRVDSTPEVITQYAPMHAVLSLLERVATTDSPVLITGESGTGKTLLARAIHRLSGRVGPMVEADATVLAESVLEVELFGHERGAFTGAIARRAGLIELAASGTLFVDGIGVLGAKLQAKLARALEHGSFFRIGGTQKVDVAVRLVTASNHDLDAAVLEGRFRDDLLYRLNVVTVSLPPLRERVVDIPLLADHFLRLLGGAHPPVLTSDAVALMQEYPWPGNIRELRNVIERVVLLARGNGEAGAEIRAQDLPLAITPAVHRPAVGSATTLLEMERQHIDAVLAQTNWHQGKAAKILGISSKTLYRKIREYGFQRPSRG